MRSHLIKGILGAITVLFTTSCATLANGSKQDIKIASIPEGVPFTIEQLTLSGPVPYSEGKTPSVVSFERKNSYVVTLSQHGYQPEEIPIGYGNKISAWVYVDFSLVGLFINEYSGGHLILSPDEVNVKLVQVPVTGIEHKSSAETTTEINNSNDSTADQQTTGKE